MRAVRILGLIALIAGIALGAGTRLAANQENALAWLGSLTASWVLTAFALGAIAGNWRRAVVAATGSLLLGVGVYYAVMRVFEGGVNLSYFLSLTTFWLLLAPVAGFVFGLCGWAWRANPGHWLCGPLAVGLPAGVVAGESAFMLWRAGHASAGETALLVVMMLLGLGLPGMLLRVSRDLVAGYAAILICLLPGVVAVPLIRFQVTVME